MPDEDPYYARMWHRYRRETAGILLVWAVLILGYYGVPLYQYFALGEELSGGKASVTMLALGEVLLLASCVAALKTMRANDSRRPMWWTATLVIAGSTLPVGVIFLLD